MAVIFWFSANNGASSSMQSGRVSYMLATVVDEALGLDMSRKEREALSEGMSFWVRKTAHFSEYFVLGCLLYLGISINFGKRLDSLWHFRRWGVVLRLRYLLPAAIVFLYAITDELHQYFVPERCCSFRDVLIDTAGGAFGILFSFFVRYILGRRAYTKARALADASDGGIKDENL